MKLHSIEICPRGINGWGSSELFFGDHITSIHAQNGSGKTPLIQSIIYCLGNPVTFREDISTKCEKIRLKILIRDQIYTVERSIDKSFYVSVINANNEIRDFHDETSYSRYLFELADIAIPTLIGTNSKPIQPYMATATPIFYLDQDNGYSAIYSYKTNFIKDQFTEMVRFLFGYHPKNSFDAKKEKLALESLLETINRKIVAQQEIIKRIQSEINAADTKDELEKQIASLQSQLKHLETGASQKEDANTVLNELYSSKSRVIQRTKIELEGLRERVNGIEAISGEISAEVDTLSLNEEARRIFISFGEICAHGNCGLFQNSSQMYAKNLLYLKDQMKDLERNTEIAKTRISLLEQQLGEQKTDLKSIEDRIQHHKEDSNLSAIVDAVRRLTQELIELEKRHIQLEMRDKQHSIYAQHTLRRSEIQDKLDLISSAGERDPSFSKFRLELKEAIIRWLDILKTQNVSRSITVEHNLKILFGVENIDAIKGSTKTRVILAVHAALLQLYLKDDSRSFRFLILDTPKQHEMHTDDLLEYVSELKKMASNHNAQIILSSTDFRYSCDSTDKEWKPLFNGASQNMYLGTPNDLLQCN